MVTTETELRGAVMAEVCLQLQELVMRKVIRFGDAKALERDERELRCKLAELMEGRCCAC